MTPDMRAALQETGQKVTFTDGEILRHKDAFAPDMLLITQGKVDCILSASDAIHLTVGPDTIVGEIGFLTGKGATATLRALGPVEALSLDAAALQRLQRDMPSIAAQVLRHLARLMSERQEQNEDLLADSDPGKRSDFEIIRCSTLDQLRAAQRLRYDVYCVELGRSSPFADADEGILVDDLDEHGTSFIALETGLVIGTARVNLGRDGALGVLPDLYGIEASPFELENSAIITKYAVRDSHRGGFTYLRLFSAIGTYVHASRVDAIFIDCVPKLARFYGSVGFERTGDDFIHYENGLSVPMVLDLNAFFERMPLEERLRRNRPF
ncbi:cyclic nucleotide-binding domain-containing protein [Rhodobacteraceae bacterium N5(2021)]|uniref:Cyclic nucleotide-binding domain-containing protein n=1 Tax=Gymnodinialimonas phycosphaerae TaxID=2841589 RepID=A0A975TS83_9RHOB|nr:cyclic nucleotide-binding domain-containing protein [Gymnodinialimonas phycosphaerae]MBY4894043.1 cyclic nucleotide-binding domain-containing protein [Gymnodinialimonas phycosphaerae]